MQKKLLDNTGNIDYPHICSQRDRDIPFYSALLPQPEDDVLEGESPDSSGKILNYSSPDKAYFPRPLSFVFNFTDIKTAQFICI